MQEIKLPPLAENLDGGGVLDLKAAPGQVVQEGDPLLEIDAGKATLEVPAPSAGRIVEFKVKKGDQVLVGQTICLLEPTGNGAKPAPPNEPDAAPAPTKSKQTPSQRTAKQEEPRPEEVAAVKAAVADKGKKPAPAAERQPTGDGRPIPAGPAARRLARELGVDLSALQGTGRDGRITTDDVKAHFLQSAAPTGAPAAGAVTVPPLPNFEQWGPVERQPLTQIRRLTAKQMSLAWSVIPHVTQHDLADVTDLENFRRSQSNKGPKLTVTAFALKACVIALKEFPQFNASLDTANQQLVLKRYYHLGVAVDTEHGLLVPVIRDVDQKSVYELAGELVAVAEAARQRKGDLQGATFTITNLGGIGGTAFTPIVNYPEVAILGLSRGSQQPVVRDGQVVPRVMLPLSLSYDHRVIDGAAAARFCRRVAELLENPMVMLVHA